MMLALEKLFLSGISKMAHGTLFLMPSELRITVKINKVIASSSFYTCINHT